MKKSYLFNKPGQICNSSTNWGKGSWIPAFACLLQAGEKTENITKKSEAL